MPTGLLLHLGLPPDVKQMVITHSLKSKWLWYILLSTMTVAKLWSLFIVQSHTRAFHSICFSFIYCTQSIFWADRGAGWGCVATAPRDAGGGGGGGDLLSGDPRFILRGGLHAARRRRVRCGQLCRTRSPMNAALSRKSDDILKDCFSPMPPKIELTCSRLFVFRINFHSLFQYSMC